MILPKLQAGRGSSPTTHGSSERVGSSTTLRSRTVSSLSGSMVSERVAVERSTAAPPAHPRTKAARNEKPREDFPPLSVSVAIGKRCLISALASQGEHGSASGCGIGGYQGMTTKHFAQLTALIFSLGGLANTAHAQCDPFGPVWATMTQEQGGDRPGCRGCHIGPNPSSGRWFGDTEEDVLAYFTSGAGMILVSGG